jgi:Zn finger protein HypA/HybF involved in hydrogenase expression
MKILEHGNGKTEWNFESICTGSGNNTWGCGAKLLVEESDLYFTYSSHYDGSNEAYVTFRCPECGQQTDVKGIPNNVIQRMRSRTDKDK